MADLVVRVTGLSLEQIDGLRNVPGQVETLIRAAESAIAKIQSGNDPSNPLGVLFGSFDDLAESAGSLPGIAELLTPLRELIESLPGADLADVAHITETVGRVLELFGPLKDAFLAGNLEAAIENAVSRVTDLVGGLRGGGGDEISRLGDELSEFLRLFRSLVSWREAPPTADDVASLLCRVFAGFPIDLLAEAERALDQALAPLDTLHPAGPALSAWQGAGTELLAFWQRIDASFLGAGPVDWDALHAELAAGRPRMFEIVALRDQLASLSVGELGSARIDGFAAVAAAITRAPEVLVQKLGPILDGLRLQLRSVVDDLTSWTPTPEELRQTVRDFVESILAFLDRTPLGELRIMLINFQQTLIDHVESLPFRELSRRAEQALRQVANAVDVIDPEAIRRPIREYFDAIRDRIEGLSPEQIQNATGQLWAGVEDVLQQVAALVEQFRATIQGAAGSVETFLEGARPTLTEITAQVNSIKSTLEEFDLNQPADVVIGELERLRDKVQELDLSEVPETARGAINIAVDLLTGLDLTAEVRGPIDEALDKVDPTPLLEEALTSLSGATSVLQSLNPEHAIGELDRPFDVILGKIREFGPEQLKKLLEQALEPVKTALRSIDFGTLIAPLTRLHAELVAKVDGLLDPDVIFGPLEALFQPIVDLLDAIHPNRLLDMLVPQLGGVGPGLTNAVGPPQSLSSGTTLRESITSSVANAEDPLLGFRPGDLLIPLIDLHAKLMEMVNALPAEVLGVAARRLHEATRGRFDALDPRHVGIRVTDKTAAVRAEFDPGAVAERLRLANESFRSVARRLGEAARGSAPEQQAAALQALAVLPELDPLRLLPDLTQIDAIQAASAAFEARVDLGELALSFSSVAPRISDALPTFLGGAELAGDTLKTALALLSPAPLREEMNTLFDQVGGRLVGLKDALLAGIEEFALAVERYFLPISPASLVNLASTLHAEAKAQILALGPATFKDEVQLIFDVVKRQLGVIDPSFLSGEFDALREELIGKLDELVAALLPPSTGFDEVVARLAELRPSALLGGVVEELAPLTELIRTLDPGELLRPILDAIANVKAQVPEVLARLEGALDEVIGALRRGAGSDGGGGSISVAA